MREKDLFLLFFSLKTIDYSEIPVMFIFMKDISELKNRKAIISRIYDEIQHIIAGVHSDSYWVPVTQAKERLSEFGDLNLIKAEYYSKENFCSGKHWFFDYKINGFDFKIEFISYFCGTVQDPTSKYDLTFHVI